MSGHAIDGVAGFVGPRQIRLDQEWMPAGLRDFRRQIFRAGAAAAKVNSDRRARRREAGRDRPSDARSRAGHQRHTFGEVLRVDRHVASSRNCAWFHARR